MIIEKYTIGIPPFPMLILPKITKLESLIENLARNFFGELLSKDHRVEPEKLLGSEFQTMQ
jgi:hypothetical protein